MVQHHKYDMGKMRGPRIKSKKEEISVLIHIYSEESGYYRSKI